MAVAVVIAVFWMPTFSTGQMRQRQQQQGGGRRHQYNPAQGRGQASDDKIPNSE